MASKQKKTTMAKLNREQKLRERRMEKKARKDARKNDPSLVHSTDVPADEPVAAPEEA